jgi:hypothetical protein
MRLSALSTIPKIRKLGKVTRSEKARNRQPEATDKRSRQPSRHQPSASATPSRSTAWSLGSNYRKNPDQEADQAAQKKMCASGRAARGLPTVVWRSIPSGSDGIAWRNAGNGEHDDELPTTAERERAIEVLALHHGGWRCAVAGRHVVAATGLAVRTPAKMPTIAPTQNVQLMGLTMRVNNTGVFKHPMYSQDRPVYEWHLFAYGIAWFVGLIGINAAISGKAALRHQFWRYMDDDGRIAWAKYRFELSQISRWNWLKRSEINPDRYGR